MLLSIKGLEKRYRGHHALQGVDMELAPGRIIGLLGPNGSGKTTLMKIIAGLLQPDKGEIRYPYDAERGVESKKLISLQPDEFRLPAWMKVRDAFRYFEDIYPDYDPARAKTMMELLELSPVSQVNKLSKGGQERVSLGLAFSRKAALYLLDEPLGGIDPVGKMQVLDSILSTELEDSAILLSTHLVRDVQSIFDSFFLLSQGKIVFHGDCEEIREQSGKTVEQVYLEVFGYAQSV